MEMLQTGYTEEDVVSVNVILIGDSTVGKTSLIKRFTSGTYQLEECTVNIDVEVVYVEVDDFLVQLVLFDTAGLEKYRCLTRTYYRDVEGICLVYDVTRFQTFNSLTSWIDEIKLYCGDEVSVLIVGNKAEERESKAVNKRVARSFAKDNGYEIIETSACEDINVEKVFFSLLCKILKRRGLLEIDRNPKMSVVMRSVGVQCVNKAPKLQQFKDEVFSKLSFKKTRKVQLRNKAMQTDKTKKKCCS
ncbi:uncharacterized protein LOC129217124 [Uloborus diversus]|uniref:uncharacterized protein LOC129217124 n=1 Tax=Uloborus diversus TaxID=327109 RepID=UPI0024095F0F|nr:uncharacterized protein LOC129217124 [Uloborus diversus]